MTHVFDPHLYEPGIIIVGVGGTGANVARSVARIAYDMKQRSMTVPEICLIDPDKVEEHNVGRQLFGPQDVGRNKAEVVAMRLNYTLGLTIGFVPTGVDKQCLRGNSRIIISCVDNHEARQVIHDNLDSMGYSKNILIGVGNDKDSGQVCIGNTKHREDALKSVKGDGKKAKQKEIVFLPAEGLLFPALLQPDPEPKRNKRNLSCAELLALGEQHLLINDLMATVAASYVYKLLHREPITTFLTYVNLQYLTMRSLPISNLEIESYLSATAVA
jgi:PRTRC genetic system ThiF family protein